MNLSNYPWPDDFTAGRCQARIPKVCLGSADQLHHRRRPRSLPENNVAENLLPVCTFCHNYIHAHPAESYQTGWLIHQWDEITPLESDDLPVR